MTFDVTESDLSSTVDPPDGTGSTKNPTYALLLFIAILLIFLIFFSDYSIFPVTLTLCSSLAFHFSLTPSSGHPTVPDKVQELAESLQQISGQLNTVLSALGSLAPRQSATAYTGFPMPLPQPHSTPAPTSTSSPVMPQIHTLGPSSLAPPPPVRLSEPSWNWTPQGTSAATPLFSTPISSGLRASEDLINSRWSQIFPSMPTDASFCFRMSDAPTMGFVKKSFYQLLLLLLVLNYCSVLQEQLWTQSAPAP